MMIGIKFKDFIYVQILMLGLSLAGVLGKLLSTTPFLSARFFLYLFGLNVLHMTYAIFWQQLLKRLPLSQAYMNKAIGIVWGLILGAVIFQEVITPFMIGGSILIIYGLILVVNPHA